MKNFLQQNSLVQKSIEKSVYSFQVARTLTFAGQSLSLPFFELLLTGQSKALNKEFVPRFRQAFLDLLDLLKKDSQNIAQGIYPLEVLKPESPANFLKRFPQIIADAVSVSHRRKNNSSHDFSMEAKEYFSELPDYFQRNFHFQSDGYLTSKSADLYEHQVEILFSGAADSMRRLILPAMKEHFSYTQGENLHFLEVGAGTGRLSRFIKLTFPKARVTVMDLSDPYLKKAQANLKEFKKMNFVQGDAANIPFTDQKFDAVLSCFLFHELPLSERRKVISEAQRVLKPNGFLGIVDSVQEKDKKDFSWALNQFPQDFHEPFYKNYLQNPLEGLVHASHFKNIKTEFGFFSKSVSAVKEPTSHEQNASH